MEYNTGRNKLIFSEYGRNIQKMVEYAISIEDREKRTRIANGIIQVMSQIIPNYKENGDYKQKLWDHLHIISDFRLDVDSPFPAPNKEILLSKPHKISYPSNHIKYKHYGKNIEKIIEKSYETEDGSQKKLLIKTIANHLKKSYLLWNKNSVTDEIITKDLTELSNGKIVLDDDVRLNNSRDILNMNPKNKFVRTNNPKINKNKKDFKK